MKDFVGHSMHASCSLKMMLLTSSMLFLPLAAATQDECFISPV